MKLAIMQPYFFPYIGYFQLIQAVDLFIVYDNVKYTKKGWINRNRFLRNGAVAIFSVPLKKDSDFLQIKERGLSAEFRKCKLLNQIREAYGKAQYFDQAFAIFEKAVMENEANLFKFTYNSIRTICGYLQIDTKISVSSEFQIDHSLRGQEKVFALCQTAGADTYINAIGGQVLYSKEVFAMRGIKLQFLRSKPFEYMQFGDEFVPSLSILDVMTFNSQEYIKEYILSNYELV